MRSSRWSLPVFSSSVLTPAPCSCSSHTHVPLSSWTYQLEQQQPFYPHETLGNEGGFTLVIKTIGTCCLQLVGGIRAGKSCSVWESLLDMDVSYLEFLLRNRIMLCHAFVLCICHALCLRCSSLTFSAWGTPIY